MGRYVFNCLSTNTVILNLNLRFDAITRKMANSFLLCEDDDLLDDNEIIDVRKHGTLKLSEKRVKKIEDMNMSILIQKRLNFSSNHKRKKNINKKWRIKTYLKQRPILKVPKFSNFLRKRSSQHRRT